MVLASFTARDVDNKYAGTLVGADYSSISILLCVMTLIDQYLLRSAGL